MFADDPDMSDLTFDPGPKHSTPIKERANISIGGREGSPVLPTSAAMKKPCSPEASKTPASVPASGEERPRLPAAHISSGSPRHISTTDVSSIIRLAQKDGRVEALASQHRKETAMLVSELRDRDQELNDMVRCHQQQLSVWEQDRQLILRLQHKCHRLAVEVKQQKERGVKQSGEQRRGTEVRKQQAELAHLSCGSDHSSLHLRQPQNHCDSLNDSLKEVSMSKEYLQAKEQELISVLKLKEKSLAEAETTSGELRAQVKTLKLEKESQQSEVEQLVKVWQWRCHSLQEDKDKLVNACQEKDRQLQKATTQLQDTIQQALVLQQALTISCERETNKDALLTSQKSRQERLSLELSQMRTLYRRQNREMTLLQLTLDTSKESDPELMDTVRTMTMTSRSPSTDSNNSVCVASTNIAGHQRRMVQEGVCAGSLQGSHHTPPCTDSVEHVSGSRDHSNSRHSLHRHSATDHHYSSHTHGSLQRSSDNPTANIAGNTLSTRLDYHQYPNANNSSNANNNNWYSGGQFHSPELILSPKQSAQSACAGDGSTSHHSDHRSAVVRPGDDNDDDDGHRQQDVDTEAFWQKILSVRHGNNNTEETKDLTQSPIKNWLTEVCTEEKVADQLWTDSGAHGGQMGKERCWQGHRSSPVLMNNMGSAVFENTDAIIAVSPETKLMGKQTVQCSESRTQNHEEHGPTSQSWLPSQQTKVFQEVSVLSPEAVSLARSQFRWNPPQNSSTEAPEKPGQRDLQPEPTRDESQTAVAHSVHLPSHSSADPEVALAGFAPFDEKLSSFLESPEDNTSFDPTGSQGSCSPASKLHRLLLESQEMLQALEVKGHPDPW